MGGLDIARVKLVFSFKHHDKTYLCALIHWSLKINEEPDINTDGKARRREKARTT